MTRLDRLSTASASTAATLQPELRSPICQDAAPPLLPLEALKAASIPYRVLEYEHDPRSESFGHEAVRKLGLDATAVCKTLMTRSRRDPRDRGGPG